jgi:glycerol-3-phosphate acyltransferase PlsY
MMELLGDVGHIKSCFGQFGDGASVGTRWGHSLRQTYPRLGNRFG